jgi:hypothetical protein
MPKSCTVASPGLLRILAAHLFVPRRLLEELYSRSPSARFGMSMPCTSHHQHSLLRALLAPHVLPADVDLVATFRSYMRSAHPS